MLNTELYYDHTLQVKFQFPDHPEHNWTAVWEGYLPVGWAGLQDVIDDPDFESLTYDVQRYKVTIERVRS